MTNWHELTGTPWRESPPAVNWFEEELRADEHRAGQPNRRVAAPGDAAGSAVRAARQRLDRLRDLDDARAAGAAEERRRSVAKMVAAYNAGRGAQRSGGPRTNRPAAPTPAPTIDTAGRRRGVTGDHVQWAMTTMRRYRS